MDFIDLMGYIGYICAMDKLHGIHAIYFPNIAWIPWPPWIGSYKEREGFQRLSAQINTHRIHGAGIYANIWGILMVNVTIYGIHGSYGTTNRPQKKNC